MPRHSDKFTQSDEHNARGIELADRGWLDEAVNEFKKAIDCDPNSPHAYDNLGTIYADKGELLLALGAFLKALTLDPENPETHHYLASFLASHGPELCLTEYRQSIALANEFPDAHLNLAIALADQGRLEEALLELQIAHTQSPDDELIQHELACCLIDLDRHPEAIKHLKALIKGNPDLIEAYVDLGISYTAQGFYDQAKLTLDTALRLAPADFATHYHLAALFSAWGQREQALHHLAQASQINNQKLKLWVREDEAFEVFTGLPSFDELLT